MPTHIQKITWTYDYRGKHVDYCVYSNAKNKNIDTVIFLGTVQVEILPIWVAEACPENTVVVQGAPHWHAAGDGSDTQEYAFLFTKHVLTKIYKTFSITSLNVIADSQAAPGVMRLLRMTQPVPIHAVVLLQPLGLNANAYMGDSLKRIATLKKRVANNARYQLLPLMLDKRLRHNHRVLRKNIDLRSVKTQAQYSSGLAYDSLPDLQILRGKYTNIVVICGTKDKLFPPIEIKQNLAQHAIYVDVRLVDNTPHSPLATNYGQRLLKKAFEYLEER